jgi:hypothetical protein
MRSGSDAFRSIDDVAAWYRELTRGMVDDKASAVEIGRLAKGLKGGKTDKVRQIQRYVQDDVKDAPTFINLAALRPRTPGDVIRVPEATQGVFYVGGQVRRAGSYNIPPEGRMTIRRAIDAAGGLDALAWPERAELVRALGEGRQAIVSFNLRAIFSGHQPDIYVKPDDQINIGTSFWATPLAVIRNGFRASYGFGFILDRNFGSDVFGAPPTNVGG